MRSTTAEKRIFLAFTGPSGAGKSTAAGHLVDRHGFTKIGFGDPIRAAILAIGVEAEDLQADRKDKPNQFLSGATPRYAMQTLGTEWGRMLISPNIWENIFCRRLSSCSSNRIVVDDVRFPGELELVRKEGGKAIWIERENIIGSTKHVSETSVFQIDADHTLNNGHDVDHFLTLVDQLIRNFPY